jgi:MFS family permease
MQPKNKVLSLPVSIVAATMFLVTVAVNLQVPLYSTYVHAAGGRNGLIALAFACYVVGLLPVLTFFGGISDHLGRKRVLLLSLLFAMAGIVVVSVKPDLEGLCGARLLQGGSVGLLVGAGTAFLAELLETPDGVSRAAFYAGRTTTLGLGSGALLTMLALWYRQDLVPLSYWVVLAGTGVCGACVMGLPDGRKRGEGTSPLLQLPSFPSGTVAFGLAIAIAWSVTGLVIALVPAQLTQYHLTGWTAPVVFLAIGTGAVFQPWAHALQYRLAVLVGIVLLSLASLVLFLGIWLGILSLIIFGATGAGAASFGFIYTGGLTAVTKAGGKERARAVSGYFFLAYLGLGLPSVCVGFLADHVGITYALAGFGIVSIAANAWLVRHLLQTRLIKREQA